VAQADSSHVQTTRITVNPSLEFADNIVIPSYFIISIV